MPDPLTAGKSRIEALSDGVFAIAMTLLVLKLEVPEVMHHSSNADMLRQLLALWPTLVTYVVTFLIAGGFWFLHHLTFHFIRNVNGVLIWVNLAFLMFVALLPFSAELMGHLLVHPVSQLFYFGNQFAIALLLGIHWHYARHKNLLAKDSERLEMRHLSWQIGVTTVAFAAAILGAIVDPPFSAPVFLVCFLAGLLLEHFRLRAKVT
jgi:uncharacterized membrane protein